RGAPGCRGGKGHVGRTDALGRVDGDVARARDCGGYVYNGRGGRGVVEVVRIGSSRRDHGGAVDGARHAAVNFYDERETGGTAGGDTVVVPHNVARTAERREREKSPVGWGRGRKERSVWGSRVVEARVC